VADSLELRPLRDADEPAVVALWQTVFADDPVHNEPTAIVRRKREVQPEGFLVALDRGSVVGTLLAGYDGHRGWLYHLAVAPARRRDGIGRALVARAEGQLAALGCPKVNLQVREGNEEAIAFYRALGYAVEPRASLGKRLDVA
jgi:ribosomal protein S18 acetylase RimI-like enzyme